VGKKILFPFSYSTEFQHGYSWAMELAVRMDAKLFFFTSVPNGKTDQGLVQNIYHSLLAARGKYLQHFNPSAKNAGAVKTERCIGEGEFTGALRSFVKKTTFDVVVVDPQASELSADTLDDVVRHSKGVIVLPSQKIGLDQPPVSADTETEKDITENFYDILRKSDTYKLPDNFFTTLGKDKNLSNYLRKLFGKRDN
jgi:hypothetical protein